MQRRTLPVKRRTLLAAFLAVMAVTPFTGAGQRQAPAAPATTRVSYAGPIGGSGTATLWTWVALPNSGGLQVYCTSAVAGAAPKVAVRWTADGVVTASFSTPLTATAPAVAGPGNVVAVGAGTGLTVRRVP